MAICPKCTQLRIVARLAELNERGPVPGENSERIVATASVSSKGQDPFSVHAAAGHDLPRVGTRWTRYIYLNITRYVHKVASHPCAIASAGNVYAIALAPWSGARR